MCEPSAFFVGVAGALGESKMCCGILVAARLSSTKLVWREQPTRGRHAGGSARQRLGHNNVRCGRVTGVHHRQMKQTLDVFGGRYNRLGIEDVLRDLGRCTSSGNARSRSAPKPVDAMPAAFSCAATSAGVCGFCALLCPRRISRHRTGRARYLSAAATSFAVMPGYVSVSSSTAARALEPPWQSDRHR